MQIYVKNKQMLSDEKRLKQKVQKQISILFNFLFLWLYPYLHGKMTTHLEMPIANKLID